jgi:hypothetical protein
VTACLDSMPCVCALLCVQQGGDPLQCQANCMANDQATNGLLACGQQFCLQQCL